MSEYAYASVYIENHARKWSRGDHKWPNTGLTMVRAYILVMYGLSKCLYIFQSHNRRQRRIFRLPLAQYMALIPPTTIAPTGLSTPNYIFSATPIIV